MIRHIVLWKLDLDGPGERAAFVREAREGFEALLGRIDGIRAISLESNVAPVANHDLCLTVDLDDLAALDRYQAHPEHLAVAGTVREVTSERAAIDLER